MTKTQAFAYLRTSSAANVGDGKDSAPRQAEAIEAYAKRAGNEIVAMFYDPATSGADPVAGRTGFAALLDEIEADGTKTVIVEDNSRFARDLLTQELGILALIERGVTVFTASGDDLTETDDPMKVAMRQIAGAFAQLEKARLVSKLKAARDRKRATGAKVEGRKRVIELHPDAVALARKLRRKRPKGGQMSFANIGTKLAQAGHLNAAGKPYAAASVRNMLVA